MTIDPAGIAKFAGEVVTLAATVVGACWATLKRYINGSNMRIEQKLDDHIESMASRDGKLDRLVEDVSGIKGYLGIGMPRRGIH